MAVTEITYTVDAYNCGDNSDTENLGYAEAIREALQEEFSEASVYVEIGEAVSPHDEIDFETDADLIDYDEIAQSIKNIASRVWDNSVY